MTATSAPPTPPATVDALYFRVSSDRQTTANQFDDLLQVAERDGSGRDWAVIRRLLAQAVYERVQARQTTAPSGDGAGDEEEVVEEAEYEVVDEEARKE